MHVLRAHSQRWLLPRHKVNESQREDREIVTETELRAARIFYTRCASSARALKTFILPLSRC